MMELDIYKKYDAIYNILDILSKSCVTHIFSHNFVRIKINSYDSLPHLPYSLHSLNQFRIRIKTTTIIIYYWKNVLSNYLKITMINKLSEGTDLIEKK